MRLISIQNTITCVCELMRHWVFSDFSSHFYKFRCEFHSLLFGILTALPTGAASAIAVLVGENSGPVVGVAISVSLLPPAVNAVSTAPNSKSSNPMLQWMGDKFLLFCFPSSSSTSLYYFEPVNCDFHACIGHFLGIGRSVQVKWKRWYALWKNRCDTLLLESSVHWVGRLWLHQYAIDHCKYYLHSSCRRFNTKSIKLKKKELHRAQEEI